MPKISVSKDTRPARYLRWVNWHKAANRSASDRRMSAIANRPQSKSVTTRTGTPAICANT